MFSVVFFLLHIKRKSLISLNNLEQEKLKKQVETEKAELQAALEEAEVN